MLVSFAHPAKRLNLAFYRITNALFYKDFSFAGMEQINVILITTQTHQYEIAVPAGHEINREDFLKEAAEIKSVEKWAKAKGYGIGRVLTLDEEDDEIDKILNKIEELQSEIQRLTKKLKFRKG